MKKPKQRNKSAVRRNWSTGADDGRPEKGREKMNLEKFKFESRLLVFRMAKLMLETAADESIKKEPEIQHKIVSTALTLLVEAEALEKELEELEHSDSDKSISE